MSNTNLIDNEAASGIDYVYLDVVAPTLQATTYTSVPDYSIFTNAHFEDGQLIAGTTLFSDSSQSLMAQATTINIGSLTDSNINLSFSLTREDGKVLQGNYTGTYTIIE